MRNALKQISPFKMFLTLTGAMFIMVAISVPSVASRLDDVILSNAAGDQVFEVTTKAE
jgi:hypothetical protein